MIGPAQAGSWIRPKLWGHGRSLVPCVWHMIHLQGQEETLGMRGLCRVADGAARSLPNQ